MYEEGNLGPIIQVRGGWYTIQIREYPSQARKHAHVHFKTKNPEVEPFLKSHFILAGMAAVVQGELKLGRRKKIEFWRGFTRYHDPKRGQSFDVWIELKEGITAEKVHALHAGPLRVERYTDKAYQQDRLVNVARQRHRKLIS